MKTRPTLLTLVGGALVLFVCLPGATAEKAPDESQGKKAFLDQKCNKCHAVETHGIEAKAKSEKMRGPDLSDVGSRREPEWMTDFLLKKIELDGKKHKSDFEGTRKQLAAIVAWLEELKAEG